MLSIIDRVRSTGVCLLFKGHIPLEQIRPSGTMPPTLSPEYAYLALDCARMDFVAKIAEFSREPISTLLFLWPYHLFRIALSYLRFRISLRLAQSLLLEHRILSTLKNDH